MTSSDESAQPPPESLHGSAPVEPLWRVAIASAQHPDCAEYAAAFKRAATSLPPDARAPLELLGRVTATFLPDRASRAPLKDPWCTATGRISAADDLSDEELDSLAALLDEMNDVPELAARICDLLWFRRKKMHEYARRAAAAYLRSASSSGAEFFVMPRLERALLFVAVTGNEELRAEIIAELEVRLGPRPSELAASALGLLLSLRPAGAAAWAERAEAYAAVAATGLDQALVREFYECAAKCHRKRGDAEAEQRAKIAAAETYVVEAERASDAPSALFMKSQLYLRAIDAFRRVGKCRPRVDALNRDLLEVQERIAVTLPYRDVQTVNMTSVAAVVTQQLEGLSLLDALLKVATMLRPPSYAESRRRAEAVARDDQLTHYMGREIIDDKGRLVASVPGGNLDGSPDSESAILGAMYEHRTYEHARVAVGVVEAAVQKIWLEHEISEKALLRLLLQHNPIVPSGRAMLFARVLYAGLEGDFVGAAHLALPQLEHALRALLNRFGVITTKLSDEGIQEQMTLGPLLELRELAEILGADMIFDMKSLLTERAGSNLRNRLAHGLLEVGELNETAIVYAWGLTLRFCCLPFIGALVIPADRDSL